MMRRKKIYPHKSLRHMPFRVQSLLEGLAAALVFDGLMIWQLPRILQWHSRAVEAFLNWANVPWERGREITLLPGVSVGLLRTSYLDYQENPVYPWAFLLGATILFLIARQIWPAPVYLILLALPVSFALTLVYLETVSPFLPYTPEDFGSIWYHGEAYVWLLIPWIFAVSFFTLAVPFLQKLSWAPIIVLYAFVWSSVRLALALATFYYFGPVWMPFFYFALGFLADFLYIVAFYSLAMDRAATWLVRQKEVWEQ